MSVLFDTSVAIALRDGDRRILERAANLSRTAFLSVISIIELEGGVAAATVDRTKRRSSLDQMCDLLEILPFTVQETAVYRQIVENLGFSRPKIIDRMIAAQAITSSIGLATLNARDFRGIPRLEVEDWSRS